MKTRLILINSSGKYYGSYSTDNGNWYDNRKYATEFIDMREIEERVMFVDYEEAMFPITIQTIIIF